MAERRMYAKTIVLSDAFLDLPMTARCLYFTLGMVADDDGFVNSPRAVQRQCGASNDDMLALVAKRFVLCFDSGVIVIKHWRINNYLRSDRYQETKYIDEKASLSVEDNGAYTENERYTKERYTQYRLGKDRLGKDKESSLRSDSCAEVCDAASTPQVMKMPLNDGTDFTITAEMVEKWTALYPAVDIMQQLRSMVGWCDANPKNRKTKRGVLRFINGWLAREQDKKKPDKPERKYKEGFDG